MKSGVANSGFGNSFAPIDFTLQYSEQKDETTLEYACELIEENYLEKGDGLSLSILRNSAKSIFCTKGLIKIVI